MSCQNSSPKSPSRKYSSRLSTPLRAGVVAVAACFISAPVLSNPLNPVVVNGTASFNQVGSLLTVTNSNGAIINWDKFSIKAGETTHFAQTSASSAVMNRVLNDPSAIYGTLSSNGRVWLINPAGIMVGPGGRIDTAGFVASTLNISNADFLAGRKLFENTPGAGNVINQGEIRTPAGGSVYLIGSNVTNEGLISTPNGETILAAGATVSLIDSALPGVKVDITGAAGNATNLGQITAEAGRIGIAGVIVRNSGLVNASSVVNEGGRVFLKATKEVSLDSASIIRADAGRDGKGGNILVWGDETARVDGTISARGGSASGDGGFIETSAHKLGIAATARVSTLAPHGKAGTWLLDPYDFNIEVGGDITGADLSTALEFNDVTIQTDLGSVSCTGATCGPGNSDGNGDIFVNDAIAWTGGNRLTLSAYRDIGVYANITTGAGSTLILRADNTGTGIGSVLFDASITTGAGGQTHLYYNPASYAAPIDFSGSISGGHTAWMLVNDLGNEVEANTGLQGMAVNLAGNYALGRNVDASATASWNGYAGFVPIGDSATPFTGRFDGLGHTVSGLTINRPATDHVGLFGFATDAVIKNVILGTSTITGQYYVGGLVGSLNGGSIAYSNSFASISGASGIGGLAGQLINNAVVSNSASDGTVSATDTQGSAGGLIGAMACCGSPSVEWSHSSADVDGIGYLGGLVGWMANGQINSSGADGNVTGSGDGVGGLVGKAGQGAVSSPAEISNSSATGFVIGVSNVGGLVGENTEYSVVLGSYSSGNVMGSGNNIGGLVGNNAGAIVNSLAAPFGVSGVKDVGGLVGFNSDIGVVTNSHYNFSNVSVNGVFRVTEGALYNGQYLDWLNNGKSLSIGNYSGTLPLNGGYHEISDIHGLRDLLGFANSPGLKFRLAADIDLSAVPGDVHIPYFSALELDGAGHVITGLNLNLPNTHVGFIGRLDAGTVKNIGIVGGSVSANGGVGGLVGLNKGGTVNNAYSTATITGGNGYDIGGLVGFNSGGTVSDSHSGGNVTGGAGSTRTGGLVGANFGTITNSHATGTVGGWREVGGLAGGHGGDIGNSYATGPVSGTGTDVGGLVGHAWYGSISDSYATGNVGSSDLYTGGLIGYAGYNNGEGVVFTPSVTRTYATGTVSNTHPGYSYAGGLIGANEGTVANSFATGAVSGNSGIGGLAGLSLRMGSVAESYATGAVAGIQDVGGLIGENRAPVQNSYATGAASGTDRVGGLAGWNSSTLTNSYATGLITSGGALVGGLVGVSDSGTVSNSFWDMDTTGQATSAGGGTGLSTPDMKTATTYTGAGWSATYWNVADGAYPTLKNMPSIACTGYDNCWTGAIDSLWATPGNWTAGLPGGSQTVKIDVAGTPTISLTGVNPSFGSLWLAENLDVDAGVTFTLGNLFTLNAGTATFNGEANVHGYAQSGGTLAGSGNFTVTNSFSKTAGDINRSGDMIITQAVGTLNFAATQVGGLFLDASTINLGAVTSTGAINLTTDNLHVSGAVSSGNMQIAPHTYTATTLGRNDVANNLGLLQSDLDNLTTGYMYIHGNSLTVDSGSPTIPVTFAHVADYLYTNVNQVTVNSPLTLSRPGTALYLNANDRLDINAAVTVGAGGIFLGRNASSVSYLVGVGSKTYPGNTVELTNTELRRIDTTGPVIIGDPYNAHGAGHGPMQIVGPIDLTDTAPQLRLVGNGITQAAGATITVPQLAVDGYGSINLPEANQVGTFAAKSANGSVTFANAGPLTIGKVETTASPYNFATTGVVAHGGSPVTITAAGPLTIAAAAGQQVPVFAGEVWLNFDGDLSLNAGAGGQAYVEAASASTIHLDFANSSGVVRFNGVTATAPTNGLAGPGTPNFIGFWDSDAAAIPGTNLLLTNTSFSFGGAPCPGFDNCWTGAVNSLWATTGNWSAGHAPTGSESAKVDVAGTPTISVLGVNPSFGSLWLAENLNVDAGVSFTLGNLFTLNAGTAAFNGAASVHGYVQTGGTLGGSGAFTVTNNFAMTGGSINRAGAMSVSQASGALNFAATQVGNLTLRALDPANGAILLGPLAGAGTLDVRAARDLGLGGAVTAAGNVRLVAGWDGNESPTPVLRGDGIGGVNLGHDLASSGPTGEIRVWAAADVAQSAGRNLSAHDVLIAGGRDLNLAGTTSAGRHLAATARRDIAVSGSLYGQTVTVSAGRDLTLSGNVALTPTGFYLDLAAGADYDIDLDDWTPSATGGNLMLSASSRLEMTEANHVLYLSALNGSERSGNLTQQAGGEIVLPNLTEANISATGSLQLDSIAAGPGSIANLNAGYNWDTSTYLGTAFDMSLGTVDFSGGTLNAQATGAILDGNGATLNASANTVNLTSRLGGAAGPANFAIRLDTAAANQINATVNGGAAHGGIYLQNFSGVAPASMNLTDGAGTQRRVSFYQDGALDLAGKSFNAGTGNIVIGSGGSMSGIRTDRFTGAPTQLTLIADPGDMSLSDPLILPSSNIALSAASGTLGIGYALSGANLNLSGSTLNLFATTSAAADLALGADVLNVNAGVTAQNAILGAGALTIAPSGSINTSNDLTITAGTLNNAGFISAGRDLSIISGPLDNSGVMLAYNDLTISAVGPLTNTGFIAAQRDVNLNAGSINADGGEGFAGRDLKASVLGDITLDNGAALVAGNDIDITLKGPGSKLSLSNGSYLWANSPTTIYVDFITRSSGGIFINGTETTTTVGDTGFFVGPGQTPATQEPGGGLEIAYRGQAAGAGDLCAINPDLCKPPQPTETPIEVSEAPPKSDEPEGKKKASCTQGSFGCEEDQASDGKKEEKPAQKKVAQCS